MARNTYLILFIWQLVLFSFQSCTSGCGPEEGEEHRKANFIGPTVRLYFDKLVFNNPDFSFKQLDGYPAPQSFSLGALYLGNLCSKGNIYAPASCSYFPVPTDRTEFGFIMNYKDSISDTLIFSYNIKAVHSEKNICHRGYFYTKITPLVSNMTNHYIKTYTILSGYERSH